MALTLYMHPLSSYCHKALIALYENAIAFRPHNVARDQIREMPTTTRRSRSKAGSPRSDSTVELSANQIKKTVERRMVMERSGLPWVAGLAKGQAFDRCSLSWRFCQ